MNQNATFRIISAGAGSGKTYRLTQEMVGLLKGKTVRASGIIATTFTKKAAVELQERVRVKLLEVGMSAEADELSNALIGTVHGLGVKLLKRFAYEAGVSPEVDIIADEDQQTLFNQSLAMILTHDRVERMEELCNKMGLSKKGHYDWRKDVMQLTEVARANGFSSEQLMESKKRSFASFEAFLPEPNDRTLEAYNQQLLNILHETIALLDNNEDTTKQTRGAVATLQEMTRELETGLRPSLYWHQLVKISKLKVGAKSRDDVEALQNFARSHDQLTAFREDIKAFIDLIFDITIAAIEEFDTYKKQRGLIDYTDMEVHIRTLLRNPDIREVLKEELDLLMVDEFQDTSPIQLEIFLELSKLAKNSIWVGDPKQSIYGFRGAEPKLMQAIIAKNGIQASDIQTDSWRSREDIVHTCNAIFTKAFSHIPPAQVALKPRRTKALIPNFTIGNRAEPLEMGNALIHWHFRHDSKRMPGKPWMENAIAFSLKEYLDNENLYVLPKNEDEVRLARPGDVAILCRSNKECLQVAESLHRAGLKAAISRSGLLHTAEAKLVLACMKFVLNRHDSLSIAEILLLAAGQDIETIIASRLAYLQREETNNTKWGNEEAFILQLNELRGQVSELSSSEILNLLLEELDLRRIIATWGNKDQRLANVDILRKLSLEYEENCNRLHTAASLGGLLLWLTELENRKIDMQSSDENPNAVNVLTYHKSKGLEWPIVICHSLEQNLRADVWGITIVSEQDEVDLNNVLGNRWLRYWVNPYSDQYRSTNLECQILESTAYQQAKTDALQEEARLLYVGLTRARDYLVFPTRQKTTSWLNRVCNEGHESAPTLDPSTIETPWEWSDQVLTVELREFIYPKEFTHNPPEEAASIYLSDRSGKATYTPFYLDPNKLRIESNIHFGGNYCVAPTLKEDNLRTEVLKALKIMLTADRLDYPAEVRHGIAKGIIERLELTEAIDTNTLLRTSNDFWNYIDEQHSIRGIYPNYAIQYVNNGQLFEMNLDLFIKTQMGALIIQHSDFIGEVKKRSNKVRELAPSLHLAATAIQQTQQIGAITTWVHFPLGASWYFVN